MNTYKIELYDSNFEKEIIVERGLNYADAVRFVFHNNGSCMPDFAKRIGGRVSVIDESNEEVVLYETIEMPHVYVYDVVHGDGRPTLFTSLEKALAFLLPSHKAIGCEIRGNGHEGMNLVDVMIELMERNYDNLQITHPKTGGILDVVPAETDEYLILRRVLN